MDLFDAIDATKNRKATKFVDNINAVLGLLSNKEEVKKVGGLESKDYKEFIPYTYTESEIKEILKKYLPADVDDEFV
jgi:hypothetical protein